MVYNHHKSRFTQRSKPKRDLERNFNFDWNDGVLYYNKHQKIQNKVGIKNSNGNGNGNGNGNSNFNKKIKNQCKLVQSTLFVIQL